MATFSNLEQFCSGKFQHDLQGDGSMVAELDVKSVVPGFDELPNHVKAMLHFAIKTGSRNATAGLLKTEPAKALERVKARYDSWIAGTWRAASEGAGEPRSSLLIKAIAEVMGESEEWAQEKFSEILDAKIDEANLSRDEESDKKAIAKIRSDLRKDFEKADDIAVVLARLRAEEAAKRSEAAASREVKTSAAELLQR